MLMSLVGDTPVRLCPSHSELLAFHLGTLPEPGLSDVADHLEACSACDTLLQQLDTQSDSVIAALQRPLSTICNDRPCHSRAEKQTPPPSCAEDHDVEDVIALLLPPQHSDEIGRLGGYRVLKLLGVGGMGAVFKAEDEQLQRCVALKVMLPRVAAKPTARARFLREARAAAAVKNEHIVTIYQVAEDRGIPFLAMELLEGEALEDRLVRNPMPDIDEVVRLSREIADGLACAHQRGLIHRDIKPANIWLEAQAASATSKVKILDFGLAQPVHEDVHLTQSGAIVGTPLYMSPEQAAGGAVDCRSDLFSLGCVLYTMCAGSNPFRADNVMAVLRRVCDDAPRPIRELNALVPPWLDAAVTKLLAKDPADRLQTAAAVVELLNQHAGPRPVPHRSSWRRASVMTAAVFALMAIGLTLTELAGVTNLAATVIRVVTGEGTIVVHVDDPTIAVTIDGRDILITEAGIREIRVRPGEHQVAAVKDGHAVRVDQPLVTITRGGREIIKVTLAPPARDPMRPTLKMILPGHGSGVVSVAYSRDGRLLASGDNAGEVRLWNARSGGLRHVLRAPGRVVCALAFSPDGKFLLSGPSQVGPYDISVSDVETGKSAGVLKGHTKGIYEMAFSPDGKMLVSGGHDATIRVWDLAERRQVRMIPSPKGQLIRSIDVSAGGQIAVGGGRGTETFLLEADTGRQVLALSTPAAGPLCFSPDGRLLAGTNYTEGRVSLWEVKTGQRAASWRAHTDEANGVAFSGNGLVLATAGADGVKLWDMATHKELAALAHAGAAYELAFSPDGTTLATTGVKDKLVKLWNVSALVAAGRPNPATPKIGPLATEATPKKTLEGHGQGVISVAYSRDGRLLASGDYGGELRIWDARSGALRHVLQMPGKEAYALAFAPDGKLLLSGPAQGGPYDISLWDMETGKLAGVLKGHTDRLFDITFSPDGKTLVSGGFDAAIRFWDLSARRQLRTIPSPTGQWIRSVVVSANGQIAVGGSNAKTILLEADTGRQLQVLPTSAGPLCFSYDGRLLAGTTWEDGRVTLWEVKTGQRVGSWRAHAGKANGVAFSRNGLVLATAGEDGAVRLWDVATHRELAALMHMGQAYQLAFSPDGATLATTGWIDRLVKLWDVSAIVAAAGHPKAPPPLAVAPFDAVKASAHQDAWAKHAGTQVEITNSAGMTLRLIPPGEFKMGATDSDPDALPDEKPHHAVRISKPFYIGTHEVTVAQFRQFIEATKYLTDAEKDGVGSYVSINVPSKGRNRELTWRNPGFKQTEKYPASCVSWRDAERFCAWLSAKEGKSYRLPTEAEWEYACRAGTTTAYHFGHKWDRSRMCFSDKGSVAVGTYLPNAFGLHDMHGNVYEWCRDGRRAYELAQAIDPIGPGGLKTERVVRGGAWSSSPDGTRTAARAAARLVTCAPDYSFPGLGFRVVFD